MRVVTFEGNEAIREASELTKSKSNMIMGAASDFTKTVLDYNLRREQQQQPQMPFEIAESQKEQPSQGSQVSNMFVDNRALFADISHLASEVHCLSSKESKSLVDMITKLQATKPRPPEAPQKQIKNRFPRMKRSNSHLVFDSEKDVLSRSAGIPSVAHQLR